jgi:hypothetical protein
MLGVRTSIARTNTIISSSDGSGKKILSPQDFMAEEKYEFAPKVRRNDVILVEVGFWSDSMCFFFGISYINTNACIDIYFSYFTGITHNTSS